MLAPGTPGVCQVCQESFGSQGFVAIDTPKLIASDSEGSVDVFKLCYFDASTYLETSSQLCKQMALQTDPSRVIETGRGVHAE